jgi:PncC family amidohydrolase
MFSPSLLEKAASLVALCRSHGLSITTAESCTGGLVAALLTEIPGASALFNQGYITYANSAKTQLLGVPEATLEAHGAVSETVAAAMAEGARQKAAADIAIAITGIAGPGGGSTEKPVGTVFIALACAAHREVRRHHFHGDRQAIRLQSVEAALDMAQQAATLHCPTQLA